MALRVNLSKKQGRTFVKKLPILTARLFSALAIALYLGLYLSEKKTIKLAIYTARMMIFLGTN